MRKGGGRVYIFLCACVSLSASDYLCALNEGCHLVGLGGKPGIYALQSLHMCRSVGLYRCSRAWWGVCVRMCMCVCVCVYVCVCACVCASVWNAC